MSSEQTASGAWCSERLRAVFHSLLLDEHEADASELVKKKKVLDFLVQPGQVSAKIEQETTRPERVVIRFPTLTDEHWDKVYSQLADSAYFLAKLLAGEFPKEIEDVLSQANVQLFPNSSDELELWLNSEKITEPSLSLSALLLRLLAAIDQDPFSLFTILGRGREETLAELRRLRLQRRESTDGYRSIAGKKVEYQPAPPLAASLERFWSFDPSVTELEYTIKADELPASILKRLDPMPLGGLEDRIDYLVEEAYARIARLAQSYGLGL